MTKKKGLMRGRTSEERNVKTGEKDKNGRSLFNSLGINSKRGRERERAEGLGKSGGEVDESVQRLGTLNV